MRWTKAALGKTGRSAQFSASDAFPALKAFRPSL